MIARRVFSGAEWEKKVGYCRAVAVGNMVFRMRMYVTDIARWPEIGRAHAERLGTNPPAATMVEVRALIAPDMLLEIEVDAVL